MTPFSARTRSPMRSAMSSAFSAAIMRWSASLLQSPERGEIAQILLDRKIEIERWLLEDNAERRKRLRAPQQPICRKSRYGLQARRTAL